MNATVQSLCSEKLPSAVPTQIGFFLPGTFFYISIVSISALIQLFAASSCHMQYFLG